MALTMAWYMEVVNELVINKKIQKILVDLVGLGKYQLTLPCNSFNNSLSFTLARLYS